ncbi:MAG: hypothetical protein E7011_04540 [Alphaproteobacteria bacterium]|nr:hypothetical protein [Alphaproteobacteria bacterium]
MVAFRTIKFIKSRSFTYAEYISNYDDDKHGTIIVHITDGRKLKIFRVKVMDWMGLCAKTDDEEVQKLGRIYGSRVSK